MGGTMKLKLIAASTTLALVAMLSVVTYSVAAKATDVRQRRPQKPKQRCPSGADKCEKKNNFTPIIVPPVNPPPVNPPRPGRPGPIIPIPDFPDIPAPGIPDGRSEPGVPFPMSTTLPFPWDKIEGIWNAKGNGVDLIFNFKVQTDRDGRQFLSVEQLDAKTGERVAQGVGLSVENDKLVRAGMSGSFGGAYMLFIGSYRDPNFVAAGRLPKSVTVLTVRSFSNMMGDEDEQFTVSKLANLPSSAEKPLPNRRENN